MRKGRIRFVVVLAVLALAETTNPAPIGELVDVGGRKLRIHCTGSPAVIVESGGAAFSVNWELVQPRDAQFTRI